MGKALKRQFAVQWDAWLVELLVALAGGVAGMVLLRVIMKFETEEETYFPLGTLLFMLVLVFYSFIMAWGQISVYFNLEISMGCTRKEFLVSFYCVYVLGNLVGVLAAVIFGMAENALNTYWYPGMANEINFVPYLVKLGIPVAVVLPVIGGFAGALMLRYGRRAFWIVWGIWMVICVGGPSIRTAVEDSPHSIFGIIGHGIIAGLRSVPCNIWIALAVVFSIGCFVGSLLLLRRQQVNA